MAATKLTTTGYTDATAKNLLLDAGAIYKNLNIEDTANITGELLGATQGGSTFTAKPNFFNIEVDGVKGDVKGLKDISNWEVTLSSTLLEITKENLQAALASAAVDTQDTNYDIIKAKNTIADEDYLRNIAFVGRLKGSKNPVIIIVKNALNDSGLTINTEDKQANKLQVTFKGHYDATELDSPPFEIYYPKEPVA